FGRMALSIAADLYIAERSPHLAPRSVQTEKERLKPLKAHFCRNLCKPHFSRRCTSICCRAKGRESVKPNDKHGSGVFGPYPKASKAVAFDCRRNTSSSRTPRHWPGAHVGTKSPSHKEGVK